MSENCSKELKTQSTAKKFLKLALVVVVAAFIFLVIAKFAWWLLGDEFMKAKILIDGKSVDTGMPAYGQFGDAIGGVLNPIFGFLTVCFLMWSIAVQMGELRASRVELELSREQITLSKIEAERSATALTAQVELTRNEYDRKQLEDACNHHLKQLTYLFGRSVFCAPDTIEYYSLAELIAKSNFYEDEVVASVTAYVRSLTYDNPDINDWRGAYNVKSEVQDALYRVSECIELLCKNYIQVDELRNYWAARAGVWVRDCLALGIIDFVEMNVLIAGLVKLNVNFHPIKRAGNGRPI